MKRVFNVTNAPKTLDAVLLIARIAIAAMMLTHGIPKLMTLFGSEPVQFFDFMGLGPVISLGLTVFAETLCSVLILFGLGTRLASIPLIITMTVAVLQIHAADAFAKKELALHYLVVYVLLLILGSGKYSVDSIISGRQAVNAVAFQNNN